MKIGITQVTPNISRYVLRVRVPPFQLFRRVHEHRMFVRPGKYEVRYTASSPVLDKVEVNGTVLAPGVKSVLVLPENFVVRIYFRGLLPDFIKDGGVAVITFIPVK